MRFFISSTYVDLVEYRAYTIKYLSNLTEKKTGSIAAMEYFVASENTSKEVCLSELERSDIVIGIYGTRFGCVESETGRSMTEIEFDRAVELGKPVLALVTYLEQEEKQRDFIHNKVFARGKNCGRFTSLEDYADILDETIKEYFKDTEGFSYKSIWEDVRQLRKTIASDVEGDHLQMDIYEDGNEEKAIKQIRYSVNSLMALVPEIHQMYYACTDMHSDIEMPEDFREKLKQRWEFYFLGLSNNLMRIRLAVSFLRVYQLQQRLLTEKWTDDLRNEVIRARDEYVRVSNKSYTMD